MHSTYLVYLINFYLKKLILIYLMTNENCEISGVIFFHCLIFLWVRYSQYPVSKNKIRPSRKVGDQGLHPYKKETKVVAV
jgi:hypothetical protein